MKEQIKDGAIFDKGGYRTGNVPAIIRSMK
jgi:hypothetical protein